MATVATTTHGSPLIWPSTTLIDRSPVTGHLWAMVKASTTTFQLWRSQDNGATWALVTSQVRAAVQEISSIHIPSDGHIYWAFRTYEGGQDRIYTQRVYVKGSTILWGDQVLLAAATAASAGAVYSGMDIQSVSAGGLRLVAVAVGTQSGSRHGVTMLGETIDANDVPRVAFGIFGGTRWWNHTGSGRITPSLEIEHVGDGKTGYPAHLWVTWGRTNVYVAKMAWNGGHWLGPTTPVKVNPAALTPAQDHITARWDGGRLMVVYPDPTATATVRVIERNRANTATTQRQTPPHPAGVVRTCSAGYNSGTGDLRVYAVGTSNPDLYFVDFDRSAGEWTSWTVVTATDILGASANNYSVRRGTAGNARYDVLTAHAGSPNTIAHTSQVVAFAPDPPEWDTAGIGYTSGGAADAYAALPLDWVFEDPDGGDSQSAYALARQIGNGPLMYYRASDGTWQPAEVKNMLGSTSVTLPRAVFGDAFDDRTVSGGWGAPWTTDPAGDASVQAGQGQITHTSTGTVRHAYTDTGSADHTFFVDVTIPVMPTGNGITVWTLGRLTDTSNYYSASLQIAPGGASFVVIQKRLAGALSMLGSSVAAGTHTAGATWRVGINVSGSTIRGKAWMPATQAEPGWQVTQTDTSLPAGTRAGIATRIEAGNTNPLPIVIGHDHASIAPGNTPGQPWAGPADAAHTYTVRVWDSTDIASLYGPPFTVTPSVKVNPTVVEPGAVISTDQVTAVWTVAEQTAYRVTLASNPGGVVVHDSRWRSGTDTTYTVPTRLADGSGWTLTVQTRNARGLASTVATVTFSVDYLEPPAPTLVAIPQPAAGVISVAITNPAPSGGQPALVDQDVYRRPVGDTSDGVRIAAGLPVGATYGDWQAVSGVPYEYRVLARGVNGTSIYGPWTA
ncbi:hypothetical protein [Micromonospora globbae]|uniref:hypothetical protein n=1 Tax=Micromonospora globbae TaxID=1894969 RepID=UPI00341561F5